MWFRNELSSLAEVSLYSLFHTEFCRCDVRYNNISVSISSPESDSELTAMNSAIAHFARLQETTSQCALALCHAVFPVLGLPALLPPASQYALTLCHAVFPVLRLRALLWPALRPPASQFAPGLIASEVRSVCTTINIPMKCVISSEAFCYICDEVTLKPKDGLSHPWLRNAKSSISAAKWVIRTRAGLPIFVVWHVSGVSRHGQKLHALCLSLFLWFGESPRNMFQIATSAWPVSLV